MTFPFAPAALCVVSIALLARSTSKADFILWQLPRNDLYLASYHGAIVLAGTPPDAARNGPHLRAGSLNTREFADVYGWDIDRQPSAAWRWLHCPFITIREGSIVLRLPYWLLALIGGGVALWRLRRPSEQPSASDAGAANPSGAAVGPVWRPDWSAIHEDVLCPLCDYNLRTLVEPRCPECGYTFEWRDLLDPARRVHPYLFEHHPRRNAWSFVRTAVNGLSPLSFWSSLRPASPPSLGGWPSTGL